MMRWQLHLGGLLLLAVFAGTMTRAELTDEQKTVQKEMLKKYDKNNDGKLDKEERASISKEDKEKMQKAGFGHKKKEETK